MSKRFIVVILFCIVALGGVFWLTKGKANAPTKTSTAQVSNHVIGAGKKGVTLIEYGDYECPICYEYYPLVKQVQTKYGDDITFQFRNFPLLEIHQNAVAGARAAEAANLQGKFWEMHDKLYETQDPSGKTGWVASTNPLTYFNDLAKQLGLNITKFDSDFNSDAVNQTVQADRAEALKLGFTGTPTFVLDGQQIQNPRDVAGFTQLIDAEIAKKNPQSH